MFLSFSPPGLIYSKHRVVGSLNLSDLQEQLRKYYVNVLCYVRTIPWKEDSNVPINEGFNPPSLFYRKKTSKRPTKYFDQETPCAKSLFFSDMNYSDDKMLQRESVEFLSESHNDILRITQNDVLPCRILITGQPGVGKTTLLYKLAHDWAVSTTGSELSKVKLVVHLSLNGVSRYAMIGKEILKQRMPTDTNLTGEQIEECIRQNSKDVVILLDGFDESDFAFESGDAQTEMTYGSLFAALKYEEFRSCRIVVTSRPRKDGFDGNIFNPYAEIFIKGFVRVIIDEFIDRYCNEQDAIKVKQIIANDLFSLKPLLQVPIFLAMVCETVASANELDIVLPFTRTNLMKQLCRYLFKTSTTKYGRRKGPTTEYQTGGIGLDECLSLLGRWAGKSYVIRVNSQTITPTERKILDESIKAGFISTRHAHTESNAKETCYYFFHGLLRDFCVAQSIISGRMSDQSANISDKNMEGIFNVHDIKYSYTVFFFLCGLLSDKSCVKSIFKFSNW